MGRFSEKLNEIAGESRFSKLELETIFTSEDDQKALTEVKEALSKAINDNEAAAKVQRIGQKGIEVLVKIGKKALLG